MAGFDFGKGLKGLVQGASNAVQGAVDTVKTVTKDVKLPEINVEQVTGLFAKKPAEVANAGNDSVKSALRLFYCMVAADGQVLAEEMEKFDAICQELDPDGVIDRAEIIQACQQQLEKAVDPEDYEDVLQVGAEEAVDSYLSAKDATMPPKLLLWDLLAIAYSDGDFAESERRLLKFIALRLKVDKAILLEMESTVLALLDLERELEWIKRTNRPYLVIETMVKEIESRKRAVWDGVMELIKL